MARKRDPWDRYFLKVMRTASERSTCNRGRSGAVIAIDNQLMSTGYVGSPPGMPHCDDIGHDLKKVIDENGKIRKHCIRTIHAEQNALAQAAKYGISVKGGTMYSKMVPCYDCAKLIVGAGIRRVVSERDYHASRETKELFSQLGIGLVIVYSGVQKYKNM